MSLSLGAKIFFAGLAAGTVYTIFRPKPKAKRRQVAQPPPAPEPQEPVPSPLPSVPGEVRVPTPPAPEGWSETFNENAPAAIRAAQADPNVLWMVAAQTFVGNALFPGHVWPPEDPLPQWQATVWNSTAALIRDMGKTTFGWRTDPDAGATFWISADKLIRRCIDVQGVSEFEQIKLCAARAMFPKFTFPPADTSPPWLIEVWGALDNRVMLGLGTPS